ncbi:hypothetical protein [Rhizobium ruizarguesonis]|uniref:hypothetical protein n=1 Tax=Rhizobium ruizarguesonis TaxID=2081791 RepID=UPI0013EE53A4|nr:hypothetical protein [Rhizobium ruizarguesonis]
MAKAALTWAIFQLLRGGSLPFSSEPFQNERKATKAKKKISVIGHWNDRIPKEKPTAQKFRPAIRTSRAASSQRSDATTHQELSPARLQRADMTVSIAMPYMRTPSIRPYNPKTSPTFRQPLRSSA